MGEVLVDGVDEGVREGFVVCEFCEEGQPVVEVDAFVLDDGFFVVALDDGDEFSHDEWEKCDTTNLNKDSNNSLRNRNRVQIPVSYCSQSS